MKIIVCDPKCGWSHAKDVEVQNLEEALFYIKTQPRNFKFALEMRGGFHYDRKRKGFVGLNGDLYQDWMLDLYAIPGAKK